MLYRLSWRCQEVLRGKKKKEKKARLESTLCVSANMVRSGSAWTLFPHPVESATCRKSNVQVARLVAVLPRLTDISPGTLRQVLWERANASNLLFWLFNVILAFIINNKPLSSALKIVWFHLNKCFKVELSRCSLLHLLSLNKQQKRKQNWGQVTPQDTGDRSTPRPG